MTLKRSEWNKLCSIITSAAFLMITAGEAWALEKKGYTLPETGGYHVCSVSQHIRIFDLTAPDAIGYKRTQGVEVNSSVRVE